MGKYDNKRSLAQSLYIRGSLTRIEISRIAGVTEKTLRTWVDKYEWDKLKEAQTVTRQQLLLDAYSQLKAVNRAIDEIGGVPNKTLADAKSGLRKEIEALSDSPVHVYIEVFNEITEWLIKLKPHKAAEISGLLLEFIDQKQKNVNKPD
jgi:hypothetical protein